MICIVVFWLVLFVVLIIIEAITINLVSIWFAIGGIAAFITTFFTDSYVIQSIVFIAVSVITLILTKPVVKKFLKVDEEKTNLDRLIGKKAIVIKEIKKNEMGRVKILGIEWNAISDSEIDESNIVEIIKIDGTKLIVKKEVN